MLEGDAGALVTVARAALAEVTPAESVGELQEVREEGGTITLAFANRLPGYPGWAWTVALAQPEGQDAPTVLETDLIPGEGALLAPEWVPWSDRVVGEPVEETPDDDDDEDDEDEDDDLVEVAETIGVLDDDDVDDVLDDDELDEDDDSDDEDDGDDDDDDDEDDDEDDDDSDDEDSDGGDDDSQDDDADHEAEAAGERRRPARGRRSRRS